MVGETRGDPGTNEGRSVRNLFAHDKRHMRQSWYEIGGNRAIDVRAGLDASVVDHAVPAALDLLEAAGEVGVGVAVVAPAEVAVVVVGVQREAVLVRAAVLALVAHGLHVVLGALGHHERAVRAVHGHVVDRDGAQRSCTREGGFFTREGGFFTREGG